MSTHAQDRWMHPAMWLLLFVVAPPVWLFLIGLRHIGFVVLVLAIAFVAIHIRAPGSFQNSNVYYEAVK